MIQTSDHEIISRYRRVKGSGLFDIDDFSAVTGYPITRVLEIMEKLEVSGEVVRFGQGVYLLKPVIQAKPVFKYDWQPQQDKLEVLWSMLSTRRWTSKQDIIKRWKYSDTALTRYLRALRLSGNIKYKMDEKQSFYQKSKPKMQLIPSWQELTRRNNA
jgi:hypothetical protein